MPKRYVQIAVPAMAAQFKEPGTKGRDGWVDQFVRVNKVEGVPDRFFAPASDGREREVFDGDWIVWDGILKGQHVVRVIPDDQFAREWEHRS